MSKEYVEKLIRNTIDANTGPEDPTSDDVRTLLKYFSNPKTTDIGKQSMKKENLFNASRIFLNDLRGQLSDPIFNGGIKRIIENHFQKKSVAFIQSHFTFYFFLARIFMIERELKVVSLFTLLLELGRVALS
jgi:hypothetical protein